MSPIRQMKTIYTDNMNHILKSIFLNLKKKCLKWCEMSMYAQFIKLDTSCARMLTGWNWYLQKDEQLLRCILFVAIMFCLTISFVWNALLKHMGANYHSMTETIYIYGIYLNKLHQV